MVSIIIEKELQLRSYQVEDMASLFAAINNSRQHLNPWLDWVSKTTKPEHSLQFIQDSLRQLDDQDALALGIFVGDTVIGGIGMHQWDKKTRRAQIGYWIAHEYEGKGIITRCLTSFITFLFEKIGLNKIEIHFAQPNKRSAKVAGRLGFKIEGIVRQSILRNGMPEDVVISGLLKSEWKSV